MSQQRHTPGPWRFTRVDINVGKLGVYVENHAGRSHRHLTGDGR